METPQRTRNAFEAIAAAMRQGLAGVDRRGEEPSTFKEFVEEVQRLHAESTNYQADLLRRLGVKGDLSDDGEMFLQLWAVAKDCGIIKSNKEFLAMTSRELCAILEHEAGRRSGRKPTAQLTATPKKRGRPSMIPIDGDAVRSLRGGLSQKHFERSLKLSVDIIQKAESGKATPATKRKILNYAKKNGRSVSLESLKKTDREKPL